MFQKKKQIIGSIVFTLLAFTLLLFGYLQISKLKNHEQVVLASEGPNYPFPQNLNYGRNTILPNQYTREQMDNDVRMFYDHWKGEYLVPAEQDEEGNALLRIAFGKTGSDNYDLTVSEGQGFGMIIVVMMAGHDPDAKAIFDGLWRFVKQHPSNIDKRLMAWRVPEHQGSSAFDGSADIAYALLLADSQWGSTQEFNYASEAQTMIEAIYQSSIGPHSKLPMLGDWVEADGSEYNQYTNRTSDFMLANFQAFLQFTRNKNWKQVINKSRKTAGVLQRKYSPTAGLFPDFIEPVSDSNHVPRPADTLFLEGENDGNYSYNACRVPLRLGIDALLNKNKASRKIVRKVSSWAERYHEGNPHNISAGYTLDGNPLPERNYFSTAFVAPLGVAAMTLPSQQEWLNGIYDAIKQEHQNYFEDTLNLLSLLVMTGNFWD